jgi:phosphate acetyltransferase
MKGSLHTDELMGAVVKRDTGLRTGAAHQPLLRHGRAGHANR